MTISRWLALAILASSLAVGVVAAQGRGGAEWTTNSFDAQRSGSAPADPRISVETMTRPGAFGAFKFLWKLKLEYEPGAATGLTEAIYLDRVIGFRGFKSIAFVGTESGTVHAIDVDFGTRLWKYHLNYTASPPPVRAYSGCPGGLTAAVSRPTSITPPAAPARGGGGGRGGRSGGGVGEPGRGAVTLATAGQPRGGGAPGPGGAAGPGAAGRGAVPPGTVPGSAAAAAPPRGGGGGGGGRGFTPGDEAAYVVSADGYLHALNVQNGWDNMTPALFLPANTRATGVIVATTPDGGATAYATTINGCGSQPDGVWAMDLASPQKTVLAYQPQGANIAGDGGAAIGRDGTLYIATKAGAAGLANHVIALEAKTLKLKASVAVAQANFTASPVVFQVGGKELLAVAGGGKVYLFDATALSSGPVASASYGPATTSTPALTTWTDAQGARYVAAPVARGVVTLKVADVGGKLSMTPGWTSRDIAAPLPPIVVNGVMFAASAGTRTVPGALYAFDAATGKELFSSTTRGGISGTLEGTLSSGGGNVYLPGADSTLYAFGFAIEK